MRATAVAFPHVAAFTAQRASTIDTEALQLLAAKRAASKVREPKVPKAPTLYVRNTDGLLGLDAKTSDIRACIEALGFPAVPHALDTLFRLGANKVRCAVGSHKKFKLVGRLMVRAVAAVSARTVADRFYVDLPGVLVAFHDV